MTFDIVNVFPEPVTPKRTLCFAPVFRFFTNLAIASGWSPVGLNEDFNLNIIIVYLINYLTSLDNFLKKKEHKIRVLPRFVCFGYCIAGQLAHFIKKGGEMFDSLGVENKIALVMGVTNKWSIAWGIAQVFSKAGVRLILTAENPKLKKRIEVLSRSLPFQPIVIACCDVARQEEIEALFAEIEERFGGIDSLVHCIAFSPSGALEKSFLETTESDFLEAMKISAYSLIPLSRKFAEIARPEASIVAITFEGARRHFSGYGMMGPVKATLEAIVRELATELGPRGIRVNAVSPAPINTAAARGLPGFALMRQRFLERSLLKTKITPKDVGNVVLSLCSDFSNRITGTVIPVDGGHHIVGT